MAKRCCKSGTGNAESGRGNAGNRHRSAMNCAMPVVAKVGRIMRKSEENAVFAAKVNVRKCESCCGARGWRFSRGELCENRPDGFAKRWDGHWLTNNRAVRVEKETAAETSGICQPGRVRRINWAKTRNVAKSRVAQPLKPTFFTTAPIYPSCLRAGLSTVLFFPFARFFREPFSTGSGTNTRAPTCQIVPTSVFLGA